MIKDKQTSGIKMDGDSILILNIHRSRLSALGTEDCYEWCWIKLLQVEYFDQTLFAVTSTERPVQQPASVPGPGFQKIPQSKRIILEPRHGPTGVTRREAQRTSSARKTKGVSRPPDMYTTSKQVSVGRLTSFPTGGH